MIYLASPYSHSDPAVVQARYKKVLQATAMLISSGKFIYSPIVHCHELAKNYSLPTSYDYWRNHNHHMIEKSNAVYFLLLKDWQSSRGMYGEANYAMMSGKPCHITQLKPTELTTTLISVERLLEKFSPVATRV